MAATGILERAGPHPLLMRMGMLRQDTDAAGQDVPQVTLAEPSQAGMARQESSSLKSSTDARL